MENLDEIRAQIKEEESSTQACHNCRQAKGTFKCGRCGARYCSKECQRIHFPAHRAYCDGIAKNVSGADEKDLQQKFGKVQQFKSHEWFAKHRVEIALLARSLIPPQAFLSQVLLLVVSECSACPLGSCKLKCESSKPPGGFRIVSAAIQVRPIPRANISEAIEELLKRAALKGAALSARGRLVVMTDKVLLSSYCLTVLLSYCLTVLLSYCLLIISFYDKNDKSVAQFCFTDSYEAHTVPRQYTATQLLGVINRDEKYAVPEMRRQLMVSRTL
jgi:hypothetical protein